MGNFIRDNIDGIYGAGCLSIGGFTAWVLRFWTGLDITVQILVGVMAIDYFSGLVVGGVFHNSQKTETGRLESKAGLKGLCRKGGVLLLVLVAYFLDIAAGTNTICTAVCVAFMINEMLSIVENVSLMGVPIPKVLINAIEVIKKREDVTEKEQSK